MKILQKLSNISKAQIQNGFTPNLWGREFRTTGYPLLDYPALGLKEVLCVPDDKNDVSNISFRFYAGLFAFPHTYLGISQ